MNHKLYETGDDGTPASILDRNGEVVLTLCKVCRGAEGAMPTDCPGERLTGDQLDEIYSHRLDYKGGEWVTPNVPS